VDAGALSPARCRVGTPGSPPRWLIPALATVLWSQWRRPHTLLSGKKYGRERPVLRPSRHRQSSLLRVWPAVIHRRPQCCLLAHSRPSPPRGEPTGVPTRGDIPAREWRASSKSLSASGECDHSVVQAKQRLLSPGQALLPGSSAHDHQEVVATTARALEGQSEPERRLHRAPRYWTAWQL
jgi:hypothetical protein